MSYHITLLVIYILECKHTHKHAHIPTWHTKETQPKAGTFDLKILKTYVHEIRDLIRQRDW